MGGGGKSGTNKSRLELVKRHLLSRKMKSRVAAAGWGWGWGGSARLL